MNQTTRREFLKDAALAGAAITTCTSLAQANLLAAAIPAQGPVSPAAAGPRTVALSWLGEKPPAMASGAS